MVTEYTPEQLDKLKVKITPERAEAIRQGIMGAGWVPNGQMLDASVGRIYDATEKVVGSDTPLSAEKIAAYTPDFTKNLQQQQYLSTLSTPSRIATMVEAYEVQAKEDIKNVNPENVANMERLSNKYEIPIELLKNDARLREQLNNAEKERLSVDHVRLAYDMAKDYNLDGNGIVLSKAIESTGNWILMRGELDKLLGIEASNRNLTIRHARAGWRNMEADKAYDRAFMKEFLGGGSEAKMRAAAEKAGAEVELATLPPTGKISGFWYKPWEQAGLWASMGAPRLIGAALNPIIPGAAIVGEAIGIAAGVSIMRGSMFYALDHLTNQNNDFVELDSDVKFIVGTMTGILEAYIERQQITGAIGGGLTKEIFSNPAVIRAWSMLSRNAFGVGLGDAILHQIAFMTSEMLEEGAQGAVREIMKNVAVKMQELRGTEVDWNYATTGDIAGTFKDEMMESFQSLALLGLPSSGRVGLASAGAAKNIQRHKATLGRDMREQYNNLQTRSDETKFAETAPEKMRDLLNEITGRESTPFLQGTVYVPINVVNEAFSQHIPDEITRTDLLNRMGVETDSVLESSTTGSDVPMQMGDIITMLKPYPELRDSIRDAMKAEPMGVAYADVDQELTRLEITTKQVNRTTQAVLNSLYKPDIENTVFVHAEAIEPLIQTEEGVKKISDELCIEPIVLQQMVSDGEDIPFNANLISDQVITSETLDEIRGSIVTVEGNPTLENLEAARIGVEPQRDIVIRTVHANRVSDILRAEMGIVGVRETEAIHLSNMVASAFDRQSQRVGMTAEEYMMKNYGPITFTQDKGKMYMKPGFVEPGAKGAIKMGEGIQISLTPKADFSTLVHEIAHFLIYDMERLAKSIQNIDQRADLEADIEKLKKFAGWEKGQTGWKVSQLEKLADAFVLYVREGKAPSTGLRSAFGQMKKWLKGFVSHMFQDGEVLSDEVKAVFGNMLSVESEAERLMEKHGIEFSKEGLKLTSAVITTGELHAMEDIEASKAQVLAEAIARHDKFTNTDIRKTKRYKKLYAEALKDAKQLNIYQYMGAARTDGELRITKSELQDMVTEAEFAEIPKYVYRKEGITADEAALVAGYNNGSELIDAILKATTPEEEADARAMVVLQGTETQEVSLSDKLALLIDGTAKAYHSAVKMLEPTLKALGWNAKQIAAEIDYVTKVIQPAADEHVLNMDPSKWPAKRESLIGAVAASRQEYRDALRVKDYERARKAIPRVALNVAMLRSIKAAQKQNAKDRNAVNRIIQVHKKNQDSWNMDSDYMSGIEDILMNVGLLNAEDIKITKSEVVPLITLINTLSDNGEIVDVEEWVTVRRQVSGALTANEWGDIAKAVSSLAKLGRKARNELRADIKESRAAAVQEMVAANDAVYGTKEQLEEGRKKARLFGLLPAKGEQTGKSWRRALGYATTRLENICNVLDGKDDKMGVWWQNIYKPLRDAADSEILLSMSLGNRTAESFKKLLADGKAEKLFRTKEVVFPQLGGITLTQQQRLLLIAHLGDVEGRQRVLYHLQLMTKTPIAEAHLEALANTMTTAEAEWVNEHWAMMAELGEFIKKAYKEETGHNMKMVSQTPFKIVPIDSKDGMPIVMTGGYTPIVYDADSKLSTSWRDRISNALDVSELTKKTVGDLTFRKYAGTPGIKSAGYTKQRSSNVEHPLKLDTTVIAQHAQEVIHDVTHRAAVREVLAKIRTKELQAKVISAFSYEMWKTMEHIVTNLAGYDSDPVTAMGQIARYLRINSGAGLIAYNVSSAINQTLSLPTSAAEVGTFRLLKNIGFLASGFAGNSGYWEARKEAANKSPLLAGRSRGINQTMADYLHDKAKLRGPDKLSYIGPFAMAVMVDSHVSFAIWQSAYDKGLDSGMGEAKAIEYADFILRRNQDLPSQVDQSLLQQSGELGKLFSMFYSANGALFNRMWETSQYFRQANITKSQALGAFMNETAKTLAMLAVYSHVLRNGFTFGGDDDDEEGVDWAMLFGRATVGMVSTAWDTVPIVHSLNAKGEVNIPAVKGFKAIAGIYRTLKGMAEDCEYDGLAYMLANADYWELAQNITDATLLTPVAFPATAWNRAMRAVRDVMVQDDNKWLATADALYYNTWTERWRRDM